jgi:hypothetical protein
MVGSCKLARKYFLMSRFVDEQNSDGIDSRVVLCNKKMEKRTEAGICSWFCVGL